MLFNSYQFLFLYLPVVLAGFFFVAVRSHLYAALWLAACSVFFYGWWSPKYVLLFLASVLFNYGAAYLIGRAEPPARSRFLLAMAVTANLVLLGVFKYANFFVSSVNEAGGHLPLLQIALPIGISFFTFTQIAFLVDVHRGIAREYNLTHYLLFVSYFPHLIAGPVLHHKQMMPQFTQPLTYRLDIANINVGLTIFAIGMVKKVLIADQFSGYANPVFSAAASGRTPLLFEAWIGTLAYTLQLYFDFSGYSDMAIGLSKLFNVTLPLNFNSPYKARNIIDFWRRWHMTLSFFLRDYLYIPLGGNRCGPVRRYSNLMVTMVLGGLWHGANWTFVLWGALHGCYLLLNYLWIALRTRLEISAVRGVGALGWIITFLAVTVAWVPFRAPNIETALTLLRGMAGYGGLPLPERLANLLERFVPQFAGHLSTPGIGATSLPLLAAAAWVVAGLAIVWFAPNSQEIVGLSARSDRATAKRLRWVPTTAWAVIIGIAFFASIIVIGANRESEFLYFQF